MSERSSTSTSSDFRRSSPTGSIASSQSIALTPNRQLSDGEKLKKCILELVETERTYVKVRFCNPLSRPTNLMTLFLFWLQHLNNLLENYLEPLKQETFLSSAEINALFGNIQEIVAFQRLFQQSLEEALAVEPNFDIIDQPYQFKVCAAGAVHLLPHNTSSSFSRRMSCLPSAALSCNTPTTLNCTVRSAPATRKLKKFFCPVSSGAAAFDFPLWPSNFMTL